MKGLRMNQQQENEKIAEHVPEHNVKPILITLCTQHGELLKDHGNVLDKLTEAISRIEKGQIEFHASIEKKLDTYFLGTEDKAGIISRMVGLETFKTGCMRALWIVLSVVITASAVAIISPLMGK
jgi:hypothetical protein